MCATYSHVSLCVDNYVALESAVYPGQHVGVGEDGEICPPAETPPMDLASLFVPFLHSSAKEGAAKATNIEEDLPAGWEVIRTSDGRVYYINHNTRTTSWTKPSLEPAPPTGYLIMVTIESVWH